MSEIKIDSNAIEQKFEEEAKKYVDREYRLSARLVKEKGERTFKQGAIYGYNLGRAGAIKEQEAKNCSTCKYQWDICQGDENRCLHTEEELDKSKWQFACNLWKAKSDGGK